VLVLGLALAGAAAPASFGAATFLSPDCARTPDDGTSVTINPPRIKALQMDLVFMLASNGST
jgi:hypothetical protein